jgi:hypothetical protein
MDARVSVQYNSIEQTLIWTKRSINAYKFQLVHHMVQVEIHHWRAGTIYGCSFIELTKRAQNKKNS